MNEDQIIYFGGKIVNLVSLLGMLLLSRYEWHFRGLESIMRLNKTLHYTISTFSRFDATFLAWIEYDTHL